MLSLKVGVVGATGLVGQSALDVLADTFKGFKVKEILAFASKGSVGRRLNIGQKTVAVQDLELEVLAQCDVVFFASDASISERFIPELAAKGVLCIDKSSAYRMKVPLIVPEVNSEQLLSAEFLKFPVLANPNCVSTPLSVALHPLQQAAGIERVIVSTYQSVSGAGKLAVDVLTKESSQFFSQQDLSVQASDAFPKSIAFNVMPFVSSITLQGNTDEEEKIVQETKSILGLPNLKIAATSVRVPTFVGHAMSVVVELKKNLSFQEIHQVYEGHTHISLGDGQSDDAKGFMTPREVQGQNEVFISRIRSTDVFPNGVAMWVVCDNLLKGAALNAIQILDQCCQNGVMTKLREKRQ